MHGGRGGGRAIAGLHAAGGVVGGLFYFTYPAAASLTRAVVTGRIAGRNAVAASCTAPPQRRDDMVRN